MDFGTARASFDLFRILKGKTPTPRSASSRQGPVTTVDFPACEPVLPTDEVGVLSVILPIYAVVIITPVRFSLPIPCGERYVELLSERCSTVTSSKDHWLAVSGLSLVYPHPI